MPLEFDPVTVDKAFDIRASGHTTPVLLARGTPDPSERHTTGISRFESEQLVAFA